MELLITFKHTVTLEEVGHEVEIECSSQLDEQDNLMDVVIYSMYSPSMDRNVEPTELTKKEMQKIFSKALKKLSKQNQKADAYEDDSYEIYRAR